MASWRVAALGRPALNCSQKQTAEGGHLPKPHITSVSFTNRLCSRMDFAAAWTIAVTSKIS